MVASNKSTSNKAKKKTSEAKKPAAKTKHVAHSTATITVDRRGKSERRHGEDRRIKVEAVGVERRVMQRRVKVNRRRQIDPTTCERDYSFEEVEFMNAMDQYKRTSGRMFPTCSEVLEVIRSLGYIKSPQSQPESESVRHPDPLAASCVMPSVEMPNVAAHTPTFVG